MQKPSAIGVLAHPARPHTHPFAQQIEDALRAENIETWLYKEWDQHDVQVHLEETDMVIAIGGDGAMLRAARVCAPHSIPVLGINMGHLGFLTEIARPEDWAIAMPRVLAGDYWIETRMMIQASVLSDENIMVVEDALNDIVISGSAFGRMIQVDMYIDGNWATAYNADALIVATATGSSAYALSAGGPILPPDLKNILIVPASPHLSMDRPIVLSEGSEVIVRPASSNRHEIVVSADGVIVQKLEPNERIKICASEHRSRFARLRDRNYFYRSLLDKLEPRVNRSAPENE